MSEHTEDFSEKPEPEVPAKAKRRQFDAAYKLRILEEADRCAAGELSELLRREGLYSSHLVNWRKQRDEGALNGRKRGRKPKQQQDRELDRLRRENDQLKERVRQAELIIDVQKKVSEMLGIPLAKPSGENE